MTNNRNKGKVGERKLATLLRPIFPDVARNQEKQAADGGVDLVNTSPFDFEIKYGKSYKSRMIRDVIDQVESEGKKDNYKVAVIFPDREKGYAVMPIADFIQLLQVMKKEGIV